MVNWTLTRRLKGVLLLGAELSGVSVAVELAKLTLKIDQRKLTPEDEKRLMQAQRNNKASE